MSVWRFAQWCGPSWPLQFTVHVGMRPLVLHVHLANTPFTPWNIMEWSYAIINLHMYGKNTLSLRGHSERASPLSLTVMQFVIFLTFGFFSAVCGCTAFGSRNRFTLLLNCLCELCVTRCCCFCKISRLPTVCSSPACAHLSLSSRTGSLPHASPSAPCLHQLSRAPRASKTSATGPKWETVRRCPPWHCHP